MPARLVQRAKQRGAGERAYRPRPGEFSERRGQRLERIAGLAARGLGGVGHFCHQICVSLARAQALFHRPYTRRL
jgi:hypothetical protein